MTKSECYRVAILAVVDRAGSLAEEDLVIETLRELCIQLSTAEWEEANRSGK